MHNRVDVIRARILATISNLASESFRQAVSPQHDPACCRSGGRRSVKITQTRGLARDGRLFSVDTRSRCSSIGSTCLEPAIDARTKSLQVYIVEDSPIIRGLLASTVEAAGAELVGHSADARTAIADLSVLQPDLILVDIRLKSGSGFDVLQALQERHLLPGAVKAVLTNHANAEYEQLSFRLGADRFFDKASETAHVLPLIGTLVAQKRHEVANSTLAQ